MQINCGDIKADIPRLSGVRIWIKLSSGASAPRWREDAKLLAMLRMSDMDTLLKDDPFNAKCLPPKDHK